jgi:hypothetical protein
LATSEVAGLVRLAHEVEHAVGRVEIEVEIGLQRRVWVWQGMEFQTEPGFQRRHAHHQLVGAGVFGMMYCRMVRLFWSQRAEMQVLASLWRMSF